MRVRVSSCHLASTRVLACPSSRPWPQGYPWLPSELPPFRRLWVAPAFCCAPKIHCLSPLWHSHYDSTPIFDNGSSPANGSASTRSNVSILLGYLSG